MKQRTKIGVAVVIVALLLGLLLLRYWLTPKIEVVRPKFGDAVEAVYATGTVEPSVMLPIAPRVGARITALKADEGDSVHRGQMLAQLENAELRSMVAQLSAQEEFSRRDYMRYATLLKDRVIARQVYDRAKSAYDAARAATEAARAQAEYLTLVAPADGRIIKRDGEIGQFLPVNQPLFWLAENRPLRIAAEVDEEDIALVRVGQKVLIRADAFPARVFDAHVVAITPKGDPVARSYRVRISPDQVTPLRIGMTAETNIITRQKTHVLLIPAEAITDHAVWLVRNGRLARQKVQTGIVGRNEVEILSGLSEQNLLVAKPDTTLKEGGRVQTEMSGR